MQQCFLVIKPSHISANEGHHLENQNKSWKKRNKSDKISSSYIHHETYKLPAS
jgi:hypothetical protein